MKTWSLWSNRVDCWVITFSARKFKIIILQIKGHCWCTKWCGWEPDKNWKTLHLPEWRTFWWPQRLHQILQMRSWNACDWVLPGNSFLEPRWDSFFFKFEFKALHFYAVRRKPWTLSQTKYVLCSTTLLLQVSIPTVEIKSHKQHSCIPFAHFLDRISDFEIQPPKKSSIFGL